MNKVLFITSFHSTAREISKSLSEYFKVQVCSASAPAIKRILPIFVPEAVVFCSIGLQDELSELTELIARECAEYPVLTIGEKSDDAIFEKYFNEGRFESVYLPVNHQLLVSQLHFMLGLDGADRPTADGSEMRKKHILFVDDNGMMLRRMKDMISEEYKVSLATSGIKAISIIAKDKPDLVFLDYEMPGCDGRETLEMIRSDEEIADIPVVFLTGMSEKKYIEAVLELKPAGYLLKPPETDKIMALIRKIIG